MKRGPAQSALIVDDDRMTRAQLRTHLQGHTRFRVCGEAADLAAAQRLAGETRPDFIIVELPLAGTEDAAALAALRASAPRSRLVVIGEDDDFAWQHRVFAAGALGVVHRNDAPEAVVAALAEVAADGLYASPHAVKQLLAHLHAPSRAAHVLDGARLTGRELEVFRLLGAGLRRGAIAKRFGISPKTIETHQVSLKKKLGVATVEALLDLAAKYVAALKGR